ncbi:MAG: hypothetical protein LKI58_11610 [Actinomyces sp.]|nr:hypothetical protein [Actinomyces sp.]MCI1641147.1 hypothetical protein [Actinomyces sp.]MCI1691058.1 hypothetical protein [Actinomyces sp.]MCI1788683.1 hypothetical protein [Actinomyces sp.]MCI1829270.1 hypothetical protein [Actinomyces sp.]
MSVYEVMGWAGSVLVVVSLMLPSVRRFRWLNLTGSALATIYNVIFGIWPFAAMNLAITLIDAWWIVRIERDARRGRSYTLLPIGAGEAYLAHMIGSLAEAVERWYPRFRAIPEGPDRRAFLVLHGDETIGVIVAEVHSQWAEIVLDLVTPRFRDLSPGRFVYSQARLADVLGVSSLRVAAGTTTDPGYFRRVGFVDEGEDLVLAVRSPI